ncbi:pectate lyase [Pedomonas sp. V897]|uniref:pectate lyase n=1 Tax=Pedomonas sp. V897 TaxID=3446482 RepID=UPI003EDFDA9D
MSGERGILLRAAAGTALALALTVMLPAGAAAAEADPASASAAAQPSREAVLAAMKRATRFMVEKVSTNGGYVWSYLPDMSRRWGELEARPSMIWVQSPGTSTMGHLFLDAYHATGDEYYYEAAEKVGAALIWGQHPSGGWHYFIDFAGEASTRHWYETIGANAWRMEEFQHYWGNATFDDSVTSEAAQFLLRLYLEKLDPKYRPALDKAINFVLESQYPNGGWPQRYPLRHEFVHHGQADYTSYITFNDDVAAENIRFLLMCYQTLGDTRVLDAIRRAMNMVLATQQAAPQAGWGLQYTPDDLKPAAARTYEPASLSPEVTAANVRNLMTFYRLTGDRRFLARIPEALDWIESTRLKGALGRSDRPYPTFVEIGTNRPLFVHRHGSNVVNGRYYVDYNSEKTIGHYSSTRAIDVAAIRREYEALIKLPVEEATKDSPLLSPDPKPLPRFFVGANIDGSDLNSRSLPTDPQAVLASLTPEGWWPTPLVATSNPYRGPGSATPRPGDYATTRVGDETDTSPYITDTPVMGISISGYIKNMLTLMQTLGQPD